MNEKKRLLLVGVGWILSVVGLLMVIAVKLRETWITREAWIKFIMSTIPNELRLIVVGFVETSIMFKGIFFFLIGLCVILLFMVQYDDLDGTKDE